MFVLDALVVAVFVLDRWRTPDPRAFTVERTLPESVGLARPFERRLHVALQTRRALALAVHEDFPPGVEVVERTHEGERAAPATGDASGGRDSARTSPEGKAELVRVYRAGRRGRVRFGDLRVAVSGPWGLCERQARLAGAQELSVEPALLNLENTLRLAVSERWQDLGVRLEKRRGGETEFESLREYVVGDEVRRVDWKAFARRAKPMVRQYEVERGQELFLLLDCGRRMRATQAEGEQRGWTKLDHALDATLELAAVALAKGDRVGAAAFDRRLLAFLPTSKGKRQHARLVSALAWLQPSTQDPDLAYALRELAVRQRRRATVIVVSDVADLYSVERQRAALASASRRHRLIFAALDDPDVRRAAAGHAASAAERATALELVEERRLALRALATSGARVLDALPAEAAAPLLAAWLDERRGASRRSFRRT